MKHHILVPGHHPPLQLQRRDDLGWVDVCSCNTVARDLDRVGVCAKDSRVVLTFRVLCDGVEIVTYFAAMGKISFTPSTAQRWAADVSIP